MSHPLFAIATPIIPLFSPDRVTRHLLVTGFGTRAQAEYEIVKVTGHDGVERVVERSRTLTGVQVEVAKRFGAVSVPPQ